MIKEQAIQDAKQSVSIVDVFKELYPDNTLKKQVTIMSVCVHFTTIILHH